MVPNFEVRKALSSTFFNILNDSKKVFVNKNVNPIRNQIIDEYGEGCIGFFFLSVTEYHQINYT